MEFWLFLVSDDLNNCILSLKNDSIYSIYHNIKKVTKNWLDGVYKPILSISPILSDYSRVKSSEIPISLKKHVLIFIDTVYNARIIGKLSHLVGEIRLWKVMEFWLFRPVW